MSILELRSTGANGPSIVFPMLARRRLGVMVSMTNNCTHLEGDPPRTARRGHQPLAGWTVGQPGLRRAIRTQRVLVDPSGLAVSLPAVQHSENPHYASFPVEPTRHSPTSAGNRAARLLAAVSHLRIRPERIAPRRGESDQHLVSLASQGRTSPWRSTRPPAWHRDHSRPSSRITCS